jgi:pimeloyl-ACP methyl ester carboxylesterase
MNRNEHGTFVLLPGAWMGAWIWDDLAAELRSLGHDVHALTLSGLGDDGSLAPADVTLETHVQEVIAFIENHQLSDVILVGHSYSGVVAGQVADRIPGSIARIAFVEGILPIDGRNMLESGGNDVEVEKKLIRENDGLWPHPTAEELSQAKHLSEKQRRHLLANFVDHPGKTVTDPATVRHSSLDLPCLFVGSAVPDVAETSAFKRLRHEHLDGGHWPMLTKPKQLASALTHAGTNMP